MSKKINRVKLNYYSIVTRTEPVAKIPVNATEMFKLDMSVREKLKQNAYNYEKGLESLDCDGRFYANVDDEKPLVKKL